MHVQDLKHRKKGDLCEDGLPAEAVVIVVSRRELVALCEHNKLNDGKLDTNIGVGSRGYIAM